jgi:hypothetical protein
MADFKNGRKVVSVTMLPELFDKIQQHCKEHDVPVSVWCRDLIKKELERQ